MIHENVEENRDNLYESIVNFSDDAIISKTLNGTIISWNRAAEKIFGYTEAEIIGQPISLLIPPDRINEEAVILEKVKSGSYIEHYETERFKKDGSVISISLTVSPLKNGTGEIVGASKIARDITEQKKRMENLIASYKEVADYKYALDESCIVAITDQKGIITYVNENFCKISKFTSAELIGQDHRIINSAYHDQAFIKGMWVTIANGSIWKGELRNKAKDGTIYWVDTTIVPFLNDSGKPYQYVAIRSDITNRKTTEQLHIQAQYRYQQVVDNILDGLVICDLDGTAVFANEQMLKMFGLAATNELQMKFTDHVAAEYHSAIQEIHSRMIAGEVTSETIECEGIRSNGQRMWMEARMCKISENGIVTGFQTAIRDITHQRNTEIERKKMIVEIVQRNKNLEQFSYMISHNLRAPVANIIGISDLMNTASLTEEEKTFLLDNLVESVKKLDHVIMDLNQLTQASHITTEAKEHVDFSTLVYDITTSINNIMNDDIIIKTDFGAVKGIFTVKNLMHSIFYNLIINSIKYKKKATPLVCEIKSDRNGNSFTLLFKDNGLGIDLEQTGDQIFEIYKRFHIGTAEGKGLGLFMVKNHVETLKGRISVSSAVNVGTEFKIELTLPEEHFYESR